MDAGTSFASDLDRAISIARSDYRIKFSKLQTMIDQYGHIEAAKKLMANPVPSDGFIKLFEVQRLDLSIEAIALQPEHQSLFSTELLKTAKSKLGIK